jgi:hypothetical protein
MDPAEHTTAHHCGTTQPPGDQSGLLEGLGSAIGELAERDVSHFVGNYGSQLRGLKLAEGAGRDTDGSNVG